MATLADLFSLIDSQKRKLGDVVSNPVDSLMQAIGNANDQARNVNEMTRAAANESAQGQMSGPASMALAEKLAESYNPAGMISKTKIGDIGFDPRFDKRVKEISRLKNLTTTVDERAAQDIPQMSIVDLEGKPFITSMSDRTRSGGLLQAINDVNLNTPINLQGGQGFMFENPGMVWASGKSPVKQIQDAAQIVKSTTGQNPIYLPWRMAPTGGDFATMTGETMLSYAGSNMGKQAKRSLDSRMKKMIPGWKGVDDPASLEQFASAPDKTRKAVKRMLDTTFRDAGGLGIGEARLAVTDPRQLVAQEGGLMNIGEIFAGKPAIKQSGHASYPMGVPGQGLGQLKEDINIFQLLPDVVEARQMPSATMPRTTDIRAMQMKPYAGIITEDIIRKILGR